MNRNFRVVQSGKLILYKQYEDKKNSETKLQAIGVNICFENGMGKRGGTVVSPF